MTYEKAQFYACLFFAFVMWPVMMVVIWFITTPNPVVYWIISGILTIGYYTLTFKDLRSSYLIYKKGKK